MSIVETPSHAGLVARVTAMLKTPSAEWDVIDGEPATAAGLFTGYVCILALIPAIASIISGLLTTSLFSALHLGFGLGHVLALPALVGLAVVAYVTQLVSVFVLGFLADALAPSFDGQKSQIQGLKLAAYSPTAAWVSAALRIIPVLGVLAAIAGAIYSIYTFWIGAPKLMKVPAEKAVGYNIVLILAWLVVYFVMAAALGAVVMSMFVGSIMTAAAVTG